MRKRRWLISVPVWGARYVDIFRATALPMLKVAAAQITDDVRLILHTDDANQFERDECEALSIETRRLPAGYQWFNTMSRAHREVIDLACHDDIVVLLTADMVVSREAFAACRKIFDRGKRLVCCNAMRALDEGVLPHNPSGRELSEWAWRNRHPMVRDCTWPDGRSEDLSRVYFENGKNVTCRTWMPHPFALRSDNRRLKFNPTVDSDLIANYEQDEIHLVNSPDELAVMELSPPSKTAGARDLDEVEPAQGLEPMAKRYGKILPLARKIYPWVLRQRIVVAGNGEGCGDEKIIKELF